MAPQAGLHALYHLVAAAVPQGGHFLLKALHLDAAAVSQDDQFLVEALHFDAPQGGRFLV